MISKEIRRKIIDELAKDGNILNTCRKVGIAPATFYRWRKDDPGFRKRIQHAIQIGRQNMSSVAEHALMLLVKDKNLGAIKWFQVHNDSRYRPKPRRVLMEHMRSGDAEEKFIAWRKEQLDEITNMYKKATEFVAEMPYDEEEKIANLPPEVDATDTEDSNPSGT